MSEKAGIEFKFDDMSGGELIQAIKQITEKKEFLNMLKDEQMLQTGKLAWEAAYQLMTLGIDIETSKQAIKMIIDPFTLEKAKLIAVNIMSPIGNHSKILCIGTDGIICGINCEDDDDIESNMMKEIIHDDIMEIFPKHEENLREKVTTLTSLYNKFKDMAGAFFMAEEIKDSTEDSPIPFKS